VPRYGLVDTVPTLVVVALAIFGAIQIVRALLSRLRSGADDGDWDWDADDVSADGVAASVARGAAVELEAEFDWWEMTPQTLEAQPAFRRAVAALSDGATPVSMVVPLTRESSGWVASMALAALAARDDVPEDWVAWATRNPSTPSNC
jgi:hypothetical protein